MIRILSSLAVCWKVPATPGRPAGAAQPAHDPEGGGLIGASLPSTRPVLGVVFPIAENDARVHSSCGLDAADLIHDRAEPVRAKFADVGIGVEQAKSHGEEGRVAPGGPGQFSVFSRLGLLQAGLHHAFAVIEQQSADGETLQFVKGCL